MNLQMLVPYLNVILTTVVILLAGLFQNVIYRILKRMAIRYNFDENRRKVISKISSLTIFVMACVIVFGIWGVDKDQVGIYITSIVTILGVAFFAQWSHLSNISAGVILYFNHPVKMGDRVTLKSESNPLSGIIKDIGLFFTTLKTDDNERILIPNSSFLQSIVSVQDGTPTPSEITEEEVLVES